MIKLKLTSLNGYLASSILSDVFIASKALLLGIAIEGDYLLMSSMSIA